jgi:predicted dehydrogenase
MIRIGYLGFGSHSRRLHVPALQRALRAHPGRWRVEAICDLDPSALAAGAAAFPQARAHTSLMEMLDTHPLDAVVAITPIKATAAVATTLASRNLPALIEKPLGENLAQAERLCRSLANGPAHSRIMVSANRRFHPLVRTASRLLADREVFHVRATLHRRNRSERGFFADAVFHPADTLRFLLGEVTSNTIRPIEGAAGESGLVIIQFRSGASGLIEALPMSDQWQETIDFRGPDFHLHLDLGERVRLVERDRIVAEEAHAPALSAEERDGTYAETLAFLEACEGRQTLSPTPADILRSMRMVDLARNGARAEPSASTLAEVKPVW